jgi:mycothiol synthase
MATQGRQAAPAGAAVVRGIRPGEEAAILGAMLAALHRGEYDAVERYQLEAETARMAHHPAGCAVAEVDGQLAGWVVPADDDLLVVPAFRRRGVGRQLVAAGRTIAAAAGDDRLRLWVPRRGGPEAFARACGLRYTSSLWQMRLSAEALAAVPEPAFPAGVAVRPLRLGVDERPFVALVNDVFEDHPSPLRLTEEEVGRVHATPGFDAATILVVEDVEAGRMVGFCRVHPYAAADGRPAGEVRLLGVDRAWRGRGLGRAVTAWGVAELRRRGATSVVLAVEGENRDALRLYTDLGFRLGVEWPHWSIPTAPDAR